MPKLMRFVLLFGSMAIVALLIPLAVSIFLESNRQLDKTAVQAGFLGRADHMRAALHNLQESPAEWTRKRSELDAAAAKREMEEAQQIAKRRADEAKEAENRDIIFGACSAAERAVKAVLKAPSTAEFPACWHVEVRRTGPEQYAVHGYVDAQNAYGAKLRNNYVVKMNRTGEGKFITQTPAIR